MKVLCDRGALLDAINLISGVVANRSPRPQLKCVKLTATKDGQAGQLMLEATDAELSMTLLTERVDVEQAGEALIPTDKLAQIVRAYKLVKFLALAYLKCRANAYALH